MKSPCSFNYCWFTHTINLYKLRNILWHKRTEKLFFCENFNLVKTPFEALKVYSNDYHYRITWVSGSWTKESELGLVQKLPSITTFFSSSCFFFYLIEQRIFIKTNQLIILHSLVMFEMCWVLLISYVPSSTFPWQVWIRFFSSRLKPDDPTLTL